MQASPDSFRFSVSVFDSLGQRIANPVLRWTSDAEWAPVDSTGMIRIRGGAAAARLVRRLSQDGETVAVVTLTTAELRPVGRREIVHARPLPA